MIDTALAGLQRLFGRDFLLATLLPVLLAAVLSGWLAGVVTGRGGEVWHEFEKAPGVTQTLLLAAGLAVVTAVAYVLAALQFPLIRVMEGYWPPLLDPIRERLVARQRRRRDRLAGPARAQCYPPPTRLDLMMPTRLGNIFRTAEIYPHERYGIDAVVIWPRLHPLLPEPAAAALAADRTAIDALLLLRLLGALFGTAWPIALLIAGGHPPLVLATALGWPVALLAHRSALAAAIAHGDRLRVTFDLHRHLLLRHLGRPVPPSTAAEKPLWDDLAQFYLRNLPWDPA